MSLVLIPIVSFLFIPFFRTTVYADYMSVSVSPTAGTIYGDATAVSILVDSGADEFYGVDLNLSFTGDVTYISGGGAARCNSFRITPGTGTLNIECFSTQHAAGESYNGVLATLYFKSAAVGSSTFTFTSTDPNIATKTGGTYTLSLEANPNPPGGQGSGGELPDSGIFDDTRGVIAIGTLLIVTGLLFNQINSFALSLLAGISAKAKESKVKKEEDKLNKRRGKLEKRF